MFATLRGRLCAAVLVTLSVLGIAIAVPAPAGATVVTWPQIAQAVFNTMNQERAANYLPAYTMNSRLISSAHSHNLMMDRYNTLSHQLPGEPPFYQRITNAGFHWSYCGENAAWTGATYQTGAQALQATMYNEKAPNWGHRVNILSRTFTTVGVDVIIDSATHKLWLTEDFARP